MSGVSGVKGINIWALTVIAASIIFLTQAVYLFFPSILIYNRLIRPSVFAILAVYVHTIFGWEKRPLRSNFESNLAVVIFLMLYAAMILLLIYWFGGGRNAMAPYLPYNAWALGSVIFCGEYIRFRLIKAANKQDISRVVLLLTIAFTFAGLNDLRLFMQSIMDMPDFLFSSLFFAIVVNSAVSYFAVKGNFFLTFSFSMVYSPFLTLLPFLPNLQRIPLSLIFIFTIAVCVLIFALITKTTEKHEKQRARRAARYQKKSKSMAILTVVAVSVMILFFAHYLGNNKEGINRSGFLTGCGCSHQ